MEHDASPQLGQGQDPTGGILSAALDYAERGWPVFPCKSAAYGDQVKKPLTKHGFLNATTDPEKIREWWTKCPDALIGCPTGPATGWVLDVDVKEGAGGDESWSDLLAQHGGMPELPETLVATTRSGGKHYWWAWAPRIKNSTSVVGKGIDVRGDGGYVILPPSPGYSWQEDEDVRPAPAPQWLIDLVLAKVEKLEKPADKGANTIISGKRNDTLTTMAGRMRRGGFDPAEIAAALKEANRRRCQPPLSDAEVLTIATSVGRYPPGEKPPDAWQLTIENAATFCAPGLVEPAAVIEGLLRLTEVGQIAAPPKTHKSHLALMLALCVATGRDFVGHATTKGKVLVIDNECLPGTVKRRLLAIAAAMSLGDEWKGNLDVICLRGHTMPVDALASEIQRKIKTGTYTLIVLDALYRAYPDGFVENDNGCWVELHNSLTHWAEGAGSAFLGILHTSKGNQANKSVTDIGAGGGAQSRAADCHMALREHEDEDHAVLEAAVRSWPKLPLRGLVFQYPLWHEAPEIDTAKLKGAAPQPKTRTKDMTPDEFVSSYLTEEPQSRGLIEARAMAGGMRQTAVRVMVGSLIQAKVVYVWTNGLSTVPEPTAATFLGRLKTWRAEHPDGSRAAAVAALAVAKTRVYDLWSEASP